MAVARGVSDQQAPNYVGTQTHRCVRDLFRGVSSRAFDPRSRRRLPHCCQPAKRILCTRRCRDLRSGGGTARNRPLYRRRRNGDPADNPPAGCSPDWSHSDPHPTRLVPCAIGEARDLYALRLADRRWRRAGSARSSGASAASAASRRELPMTGLGSASTRLPPTALWHDVHPKPLSDTAESARNRPSAT